MYLANQDGVTHINCYSKGKTWLGRILSNFAPTEILTEDGKFSSIEGYWYWLLSGEENLRKLAGWQAKIQGRQANPIDYPSAIDLDRFSQKIKLASLCKLDQHPHIREALQNSVLPLTHYYLYGLKQIYHHGSDWQWEFYSQVRSIYLHTYTYNYKSIVQDINTGVL